MPSKNFILSTPEDIDNKIDNNNKQKQQENIKEEKTNINSNSEPDTNTSNLKNIKNESKVKNKNIINESKPNTKETIKDNTKKYEENKIENKTETKTEYKPYTPIKNDNNISPKSIIISLISSILILGIIVLIILFSFDTNIKSGVFVNGYDVSNLSESDAKYQLDTYVSSKIPSEITLTFNESAYQLPTEDLNITFNTKSAVQEAKSIGRDSNFFANVYTSIITNFNAVTITPEISLDEEVLTKYLQDLSPQLPGSVIQSSYYIEDSNLIVTSGQSGNIIDIEKMISDIKNSLLDFNTDNKNISISVITTEPNDIDIEQIHSEIYAEPIDAYYTNDPYALYASKNGLDFGITIEEAKSKIENEDLTEYAIPLKTLIPNVTTSMIGTEAFPDELSSYSTTYNMYDYNRTTNVKLSSDKVHGTVIMPGETFSYNKIVGERTIAAGYKNAPMYVAGEVVDGLAGGICQVTTNLYNAALYANLEIVQRTNHQFIPSYSSGSRDATVVYGAIDFQFKNNRDYPIKIMSYVSNGVSTVKILGLATPDDYDVEILSYQTGSNSTSIFSEAYRVLSKNGVTVSRELLSKDTYKKY